MTTTTAIPIPEEQRSRPYLALGLTFLLLGLGFACPWPLVPSPPRGMWEGQISPEVLNLYALAVFLGWAHFFYAWNGQWQATARLAPRRSAVYWLLVAVILALLASSRSLLGIGAFSLAVWVYNIAHFIKAETLFAGIRSSQNIYSPIVAFAWFTLTLFQPGPLRNPSLVVAGTVVLIAACLWLGDWKTLASARVQVPLLTMFLLGETLVWSAYGKYMTPAFRVGIYVFHVAGASFFHYLSSYFYATSTPRSAMLLKPSIILAVNIAFIAAGCGVAYLPQLHRLSFVLAPAWFTLWVGLHLAASDLLPWWKRRGQ